MKTNLVPKVVFLEPSEDAIREYAYQLYVESGCIPGRDVENWLEAKRRLEEYFAVTSIRAESNGQKSIRKIARKPAAG